MTEAFLSKPGLINAWRALGHELEHLSENVPVRTMTTWAANGAWFPPQHERCFLEQGGGILRARMAHAHNSYR